MRVKVLLLLALMGVPLTACNDEEDPGGGTVSVGTGGSGARDGGPGGGAGGVLGGSGTGARGGSGGRGGSADDAGLDASDDGGPDGAIMGSIWCDDVEPAPLDTGEPDPNAEIRNGVVVPEDFIVTRAQAVWEAGCTLPTLRVTISDGDCPVGEGHELTFYVPADGVDNSTVVIGQNVIMEESSAAAGNIRVRYMRPSRFIDDGEWGTCQGVSGTLDIIGELELDNGSHLQASFTLELTRCDGERPETNQTVNGTFNVELPEGLDEVCPPTSP